MSENKSLSQIVADNDNRVKAAADKRQREASGLSQLAKVWPAEKQLSSVYYADHNKTSDIGDFSLSAKVATREEAIVYLQGFDLEPLCYLKGTFTSIRARAWVNENDDRYSTVIPDILPAFWEFSDYGGRPDAQLHAYVTLDGLRCGIKIKITQDPAHRSVQNLVASERGRNVAIRQWEISHAPGGEQIIYSSGSSTTPGNVTVYFPAEAGGAALTLHDFLCDVQNKRKVVWQSHY